MKTVILGAGSLGCVFGGLLARAGNDVTLIGRRKSHTNALTKDGLTLAGIKGTHVIKVKATCNPEEVTGADLLILLTKTTETITALESISHLYPVVKCAVSLQNGMAKDEHLIHKFGKNIVIGGTTMTGATLTGDGKVFFTSDGATFFGEFDCCKTERVEKIVRMFNDAGLKAEVADDIRSTEWTKLVLATPGLGVSALTRLPTHKVRENRYLAGIYVQLVKEAAEVVKHDGAHIVESLASGMIKRIVESDSDNIIEDVIQSGLELEESGKTSIMPSMAQSIINGRKTEIDDTIGYIAGKAKELGVNVPAIDLCYRFIKGIDAYLQ